MLGVVLSALFGLFASAHADSAVRKIGGDKQLFVDEDMVASMKDVQFTLNPPIRAEQVLVAGEPWEAGGLGFFTVVKVDGSFRMWYGAWVFDPNIKGNWIQRLCYAQSADGIHWTKPKLGQYEFNGSKDNNILSVGYAKYVHGASVFIDPDAGSPAEKYKMIFGDFYRDYPYPGCPRYTTVSGATSAAGIHWKSADAPHGVIMPWGTDTQNVAFYDPNIKKYVAYVRYNYARKDENNRIIEPQARRIGRSQSETFKIFSKPVEIAAPDDKDPGGSWGSGLYNSAATIYPFAPRLYLFFPTLMEYDTSLCTIQLATSRDGIHIEQRFREPYVLPNPNAKRLAKQLAYSGYMSPGMTHMGNDIWMYVCESDVPHDGAWYGKSVPGRYVRYVQRMDGFVSLDAGATFGTTTTKAFALEGRNIEINADASMARTEGLGSKILVEVLDSAGKVLATSKPICGDGIALQPKWKGRADLAEFTGQTTALRFKMRYAKLYAFRVLY